MRGHIAVPTSPFHGWIRKAYAIFTGGKLNNLLATFALFYNLVAGSSIELTPVLIHEETFNACLNACTDHGNHTLSIWILKNKFAFISQLYKIVKKKIISSIF